MVTVSASGGPISDERLAEMRARIVGGLNLGPTPPDAGTVGLEVMEDAWSALHDLIAELSRLRAVLTQQEAALKAAEGVLYALPKSRLSKRRTEVLKQVRAVLEGVRSDG